MVLDNLQLICFCTTFQTLKELGIFMKAVLCQLLDQTHLKQKKGQFRPFVQVVKVNLITGILDLFILVKRDLKFVRSIVLYFTFCLCFHIHTEFMKLN